MKEIDKEIEEALEATGTWQGSPDRIWQQVEGEIRRRQVRSAWIRRLVPVAAAAATLVATWALNPWSAPLPLQPPSEISGGPIVQLPPEIIYKVPFIEEKRKLFYDKALSLPEYRDQMSTIVFGHVVRVQDTAIPCIHPLDYTPPPSDHPRTQDWAPTRCKPFTAKLYTLQMIRVYKGDPGQTFQVIQLVPSDRIVYPHGTSDPLMNVGSSYLFFFDHQTAGFFEEFGTRLELGADGRLRPVKETASALQELAGLTPDEAAESLSLP